MADSTTITLGLCQILVSDASAAGTMPAKSSMTKIGKTYKDTANINQDAADVTEHFEEGKSAPEVRKKSKKIPKVTFSLMNPDPTMLANYVGGTVDEKGGWGYDGDEPNKVLISPSPTATSKPSSTVHCRHPALCLLTSP